jgi:hypothetical protein
LIFKPLEGLNLPKVVDFFQLLRIKQFNMRSEQQLPWIILGGIIAMAFGSVLFFASFSKPKPVVRLSPLRQEQTIQDVYFAAQFRPLSKVVSVNEPADSAAAVRIWAEASQLQHFILEIAPTSGQTTFSKKLLQHFAKASNPAENVEKVMDYYRFGMAPDLKLIAGTDTLLCVMHHWEQTGNLFNGNRLLLGFADPQQRSAPNFQTDLVLQYRDPVFSGETLYFTFPKNALNTNY